jgi:hypothetical protein
MAKKKESILNWCKQIFKNREKERMKQKENRKESENKNGKKERKSPRLTMLFL